MITIFNRKEILTTYSTEKQSEIRRVLSNSKIDYKVKVVNRMSSSPLSSGSRSRSGSFGVGMKNTYQYTIYVHKKDYEEANYVISKV